MDDKKSVSAIIVMVCILGAAVMILLAIAGVRI